MKKSSILLLLCLLIAPASPAFAGKIDSGLSGAMAMEPLPPAPIPTNNPQTAAKIALGKRLFFDTRLSGDNSFSCATCHDPGQGWGDGQPRATGVPGKELGRNTPHLINTAWQARWFWDGRAESLEAQSLGPIQAAGEMNQNIDELVAELKRDKDYRTQFADVFGTEGITVTNITRALASFERTIRINNSPFSRYLNGDRSALSARAKRGLSLFNGKARCIICHNGPNLTDNGFHNIGVKPAGPAGEDPGHYAIVPVASQRGAFKTPGLHGTALTAPYMHNGNIASLKEVIEFYDRGGDVAENRDPQIKPLHLSTHERNDLLGFLHALTGDIISGQ